MTINTDTIKWEKLYTRSKDYAMANGEIEQYEESLDFTRNTVRAFGAYLNDFYRDDKLPKGEIDMVYPQLRIEYLDGNFRADLLDCEKVLEYVKAWAEDDDRIALVLARNILHTQNSGVKRYCAKPSASYFSEEVVEWAKTIDTLDFIKAEELDFVIWAHPALVNAFAEYYINNRIDITTAYSREGAWKLVRNIAKKYEFDAEITKATGIYTYRYEIDGRNGIILDREDEVELRLKRIKGWEVYRIRIATEREIEEHIAELEAENEALKKRIADAEYYIKNH